MDLQVIYLAVLLGSFILGLFTSKYHDKHYLALVILLGIAFIVEAVGYYTLKIHAKSLFVFHFYAPVEYTLLSYVFLKEITTPWMTKVILISIPVFIMFSLFNIYYLQKLQTYKSYGFLVRGVLIVSWTLFYYFDLYRQDLVESPLREPMFWISTGLLFFFSGTIFLNGNIEHLMRTNMDLARQLYKINTVLNIILYLSISYGLTCPVNKKIS